MSDNQQESHEMVFERVLDGGIDELYCPTCGRRVLISWPPNYKKTVLVPGDVNAIHNGSKGGVKIGSVNISNEETRDEEEILRLKDWALWLEELNFENWWSQDRS